MIRPYLTPTKWESQDVHEARLLEFLKYCQVIMDSNVLLGKLLVYSFQQTGEKVERRGKEGKVGREFGGDSRIVVKSKTLELDRNCYRSWLCHSNPVIFR